MDTTEQVIASLATKLAAADLTDAEVELLRTLIAEPGEVEGFQEPTGPAYPAGWQLFLSTHAAAKGSSFMIGPDGKIMGYPSKQS